MNGLFKSSVILVKAFLNFKAASNIMCVEFHLVGTSMHTRPLQVSFSFSTEVLK
ncbi:unnamed protein product [Prunus brigantina]